MITSTTAIGVYDLKIFRSGGIELGAEIVDGDGVSVFYDNPVSAKADFFALTGVEV